MAQAPQQRRASQAMLTFPALSVKEATDFLSLPFLGINVSPNDLSNPSPILVAKVYNALLDFVTDVPRAEVQEILQNTLQQMEWPEIYREAMAQLTLQREMEALSGATLLQEASPQHMDFRLEDITNPRGNRFLIVLSAVYNYALFRDDVTRRHAEQTEGLSKLEKALAAAKECEVGLRESIKTLNERLEEEEPERVRLRDDIDQAEGIVAGYGKELGQLEKATDEEKKRAKEFMAKCDNNVFERNKIEKEIADIRSQIVSSPERIQETMHRLREKVEQERVELQTAKDEEAAATARLEDLDLANTAMDDFIARIVNVEAKAEEAQKEEELARSRRNTIDTHQYRIKELRQNEQEAARAVKSTEEKHAHMQQQKTAQIRHAREILRNVKRELESRDRLASEESRKAAELKSEISILKKQMDRERVEHEKAQAFRNNELKRLLGMVDTYTEGLLASVNSFEEACQVSSVS